MTPWDQTLEYDPVLNARSRPGTMNYMSQELIAQLDDYEYRISEPITAYELAEQAY